MVIVPGVRILTKSVNAVGGTCNTWELRNAHASIPCEHDIYNEIVGINTLVADQ